MLDGGKYPYWTEIYLQRYSVAMVYHLAAVPFLHGNVNHSNCSVTGCTAHDIDEQQYTTKHVQDGCPCDMNAPDVAKISSIIEKNGVPLVRLKVYLLAFWDLMLFGVSMEHIIQQNPMCGPGALEIHPRMRCLSANSEILDKVRVDKRRTVSF